jgi:aliphatic sulfonates family ABC transporter substrate-binding protein
VLTLRPKPTSIAALPKTLVLEDPASNALQSRIERIAPSDAPVLITGETGTGKELVARQLHALSRRAHKPFVAFNAGAVSEALAESELFGHDKGAFTGAHASKLGWFHAADGGTLFLDEIGDLPPSLQVKLLRVLQEGEVTPIGSRTPTAVDVRIIAATNVDLQAAMREKRFRDDLFYRLNVASVVLRPLRERRGDILPLALHFVARYEARLGRSGTRLSPCALARLLAHRWPGNVRELENAVHNALLVCDGAELVAEDFELVPSLREAPREPEPEACGADLEVLERTFLSLIERGVPELQRRAEAALFATTYRYAGSNQLETARLLGLSRNVVRARLIEHGLLEGSVRGPKHALAPRLASMPRGSVQEPSRSDALVLRIGFQKLGLLMLAKVHGALDTALAARGVSVQWVEYEGGLEIVEAMSAGELVAGVVGDCPAVFAQVQKVPMVYLAAEPPAPQGTALLVPATSSVRSIADLRGKRVAVSRASQAHYLLIRALEEAGLAVSDVDVQFVAPERGLRAFADGEVAAWSVWDPWLSGARQELGARVLRDATGLLPNSVCYVARRDFAERHGELVSQLLQQLELATAWVKSDPARAAELMAPKLGMSPRALLASLGRELSTRPLDAALIAAQQDIADRLLRLKLISRPVSVADAQWRRPA